ncbi:hypothetical protein SEPCBS119000_006481 [Sporothrix epigloea]|uniref:Uncharacterized protein n=1 Tax=Sporothrix epigloea TaxID=1892477 RepID=A0ABP0E386_9PEZI
MPSHHSYESRGRSSRQPADHYEDRHAKRRSRSQYYDDDYYDNSHYDNSRYSRGRGDYHGPDDDLDRRYPPAATRHRRSRHSHAQPEHRRSHSSYSRPSESARSTSTAAASRRSSSTSRELQHVVKSAITAGAVEAIRLRKTPGSWTSGHKVGRVATAAIGAAVADTAAESNNDSSKHTRRHVVESAVAGLLTDRLVNGSRKNK